MPDENGPSEPRLQGDMLSAALLAMLKSTSAYGYELTSRMAEAGLPPFDPSAMYRHLRQLEAAGLVSSMWDTSEAGPARRVYSLTATGELFLRMWADTLKAFQAMFEQAMTAGTASSDSSDASQDDRTSKKKRPRSKH